MIPDAHRIIAIRGLDGSFKSRSAVVDIMSRAPPDSHPESALTNDLPGHLRNSRLVVANHNHDVTISCKIAVHDHRWPIKVRLQTFLCAVGVRIDLSRSRCPCIDVEDVG